MSRRARRFYPSTAIRELRLRNGLTLQITATAAKLSLNRASEIERYPDRAKPEELAALEQAIATLRPGRT
jgi:hypothetical protein